MRPTARLNLTAAPLARPALLEPAPPVAPAALLFEPAFEAFRFARAVHRRRRSPARPPRRWCPECQPLFPNPSRNPELRLGHPKRVWRSNEALTSPPPCAGRTRSRRPFAPMRWHCWPRSCGLRRQHREIAATGNLPTSPESSDARKDRRWQSAR